ncbi:MAG TPA: sodium/proton-translocating pyrophosphatase, partial [Patescibacteria group bacterium]|nr:sodium/proton-translocating pyrophosphatase [Patescibacteria group bacterium]
MSISVIFALAAALAAIIYGLILIQTVFKQPAGSEKMREIAKAIQQGASAYLNRQYKTIAVIAVVLFLILWLALNIGIALGFLVGAILSALAGYIGMNVSVRANVRTSEAAKRGLAPALRVAV